MVQISAQTAQLQRPWPHIKAASLLEQPHPSRLTPIPRQCLPLWCRLSLSHSHPTPKFSHHHHHPPPRGGSKGTKSHQSRAQFCRRAFFYQEVSYQTRLWSCSITTSLLPGSSSCFPAVRAEPNPSKSLLSRCLQGLSSAHQHHSLQVLLLGSSPGSCWHLLQGGGQQHPGCQNSPQEKGKKNLTSPSMDHHLQHISQSGSLGMGNKTAARTPPAPQL